jgi:hypothetical protein
MRGGEEAEGGGGEEGEEAEGGVYQHSFPDHRMADTRALRLLVSLF